ncbi:NTP transferase domain-containing protein [bacterium]|nr:NTP transferase domain-containing protein [bacterium]
MEKTSNNEITSIILAAGKGSRMRSPHLHKVCFELAGKPVIQRSIETYCACDINNHYVVVGQFMEQVIQAASLAPGNLFFCHQKEQKGTGNAARSATRLLQAMDYDGDVFIAAGDKVIDESVLRSFISKFRESGSDMAILVGDIDDFPSAGKIVCDDGSNVLGIVEDFDISRAQMLKVLMRSANDSDISADDAKSLALAYMKSEKKAALALGPIWDLIANGNPIKKTDLDSAFSDCDLSVKVNGHELSQDTLSNISYANQSIYMIKAPLLYSAISKLTSDNAQHEEYLTDIIGILAESGAKITLVPVDYAEQVMAFNTPEELRAIDDYLAGRKRVSVWEVPKTIRPASEWLRCLESDESPARSYFNQIYGDPLISDGKRRQVISMLRSYVSHFSDEPVIITRAPGRVNIMGRHIDRQGGYANLIAIDRDLYLIVGARNDRKVVLHNMRSRDIPGRSFDTDEIIADCDGSDWQTFVDSAAIKNRLESAPGDWSHYVMAPIARFQTSYPHVPIKGMNIVAAGNVPMAAGLSSSSALVVAVAEAIAHINDMDLTPEQFVELCGQGEWYVGTRGGSADHAAMKFAQIGRVINVGFLPFRMIDTMPFPSEYLFVVCNSQIKAHKTMGAKDVFNHRLACYAMGRELFKIRFQKYASKIEHLRDINTSNLGVSHVDLLRMLKAIPDVMTLEEVKANLPADFCDQYLNSHVPQPEGYTVRSAVIFGLAECERARHCGELIRNGEIADYGSLMNASHDGDRVAKWIDADHYTNGVADYSDAAMDTLIAKAERKEANVDLICLPGAYRCSTPQIDKMVDIALSSPNVLGAQILGAGLGGCILVLIPKDVYPDFEHKMVSEYYDPLELVPEMFACRPVAGSRVIFF